MPLDRAEEEGAEGPQVGGRADRGGQLPVLVDGPRLLGRPTLGDGPDDGHPRLPRTVGGEGGGGPAPGRRGRLLLRGDELVPTRGPGRSGRGGGSLGGGSARLGLLHAGPRDRPVPGTPGGAAYAVGVVDPAGLRAAAVRTAVLRTGAGLAPVLRARPALRRPRCPVRVQAPARGGPRTRPVRGYRPGARGPRVTPGLESGGPGRRGRKGGGRGVGRRRCRRLRLLGCRGSGRRRRRVIAAQRLLRRTGSESGQHDPAVVAHEDRAGGDVPVDPAVGVQRAQRGEDVGRDLGRPVRGQRFLGEERGERPCGDDLADDPQRTALGEHVEDLVEPWVVGYLGGGLRGLDGAAHRGIRRPPRGPRRVPRSRRPRASRGTNPSGSPSASSTSASTTSGNGTCLIRTSWPL